MNKATLLSLVLLLAAMTAISCTTKKEVAADADAPVVKLQGAGASFPALIYDQWFADYKKLHSNVTIEYQAVGSGAGENDVVNGVVDFGASDAGMKQENRDKVEKGVQLIPMTAGSIVLAYNLEGVDSLKLTREAYTGIFLGKVTKWNDPLITASNGGVTLPDLPINVAVRNDSSGTTYVFSKHLAAISPECESQLGVSKTPDWPTGFEKAEKNAGVATAISQTPGSIGYIEFGYAVGSGLPMAELENASGNFIAASPESATAGLASAELPEDLVAWVSDPAGEDAYPIVTFTWIICYKTYDDETTMNTLKDVLTYCLTTGQESSVELGYIPLPENVVEKSKAALDNITLSE